MSLYYRQVDHSFWRSNAMPDAQEIPASEVETVEAALRLGHLPRLEGGKWVIYRPEDPPRDVLMFNMRQERDRRLRESDWTQMADADVELTKRGDWTAYRRALRRLPQDYPDGKHVVWPEPPA